MLEVQGLTKHYGEIAALDGVSFHVGSAEILGLVGPNGAGKSTLLECVCGLQPIERGEITWHGRSLAPNRRKDVLFYMPDGITPYPEHAVADVLGFFATAFARPRPALDDLIDALALAPALPKRVAALSKGFRRRLLIAIGLLAPHPLLLMDEPFDGLDVRQTRDVAALLRASTSDARTLFLSIHQLADAERICDRFVLLSNGRIGGEGGLADLRARTGLATGSLEEVFLALT